MSVNWGSMRQYPIVRQQSIQRQLLRITANIVIWTFVMYAVIYFIVEHSSLK
jgi:hypothetical protein